MYVMNKSIFSAVVLTASLLTPSAFSMDDSNLIDAEKRTRHKFEGYETLSNIADDNKRQIFINASDHTHPGYLRLVCLDWRDIIDEATTQDMEGQYITLNCSPKSRTLSSVF